MEGSNAERALDEIRGSVESDRDGLYFEYHRTRLAFTLRIVENLASGRPLRILDVGCYPYYAAGALEQLGHVVQGISSVHEPVERSNVVACNIEVDPFPWPNDSFDVVIFAEVLEHLPQSPVPALLEMRRVTAAGGHLIVTTPNLASARQRLTLLRGRTVMYPIDVYFEDGGRGKLAYHRHNREYIESELRSLLEHTGWRVVQAGDFMAYPTLYRDRADRRFLEHRVLSRLKYASHLLIPRGKDTLFALATPQVDVPSSLTNGLTD